MNKERYCWAAAVVLLVLSGVTLFAVAMTMKLNHDEQQFIAAGALVGREGLLPYRDFAYFHTPILPFLYGGLFRISDHLLLAGRAFSVVLTLVSAAAIFGVAWSILKSLDRRVRILLATGAALTLICNPLVVYSSWKAWNHSFPLMLLALALISGWLAVTRKRDVWFAVAGLCVALAAGTRISYAPLALPFLIMAGCAAEGDLWRRLGRVIWCGVGMTIGAIPTLVVIAQAPEAFLFDNFTYNSTVNVAFRAVVEQRQGLWLNKILFFLRMVIHPATLSLLVMMGWLAYRLRVDSLRMPYLFWSALLALPFALLGALAATPSYSQYYSPVVPILVLGVIGGMSAMTGRWQKISSLAFSVVAVVAVLSSIGSLGKLPALAAPAKWVPVILHEEGLAIRKHVPAGGIVATIAPILPLEGGLEIYPELASGPFGWRTAPFVAEGDRQRFHIAGLADLPQLMVKSPPAAFYIGYERKYEDDLADFAAHLGFKKMNLGKKKALWMPKQKR